MRALRRLLDGIYLGAGVLAGLFLIAIFLLMMALSAGRQFGLNVPAGDDFTSWCMAAMAFLGLAHTFKRGELIRVGLLVDRLRGRTRHLVEIAALLLGCLITGLFALNAVFLVWDSFSFNDVAQGVVAMPLWIPQTGFATGLVILFMAFVDEFVIVLRGHPPSYDASRPTTAEEVVERAISSGA